MDQRETFLARKNFIKRKKKTKSRLLGKKAEFRAIVQAQVPLPRGIP